MSSSCGGRREVSAPPFAVWEGGCFGGGLGQQALCDEHMAVVPVLACGCPLQGPVPPPLLACLGRGRPGLGSVPPCLGSRRGSHLCLLPLAPGHLAGGLLQLIHPLPGRREQRGADQHHARESQKTTDPDQHPSPDQQAAVDLHALRGCVVAHQLYSSRRSEDGCTKGPVTSR